MGGNKLRPIASWKPLQIVCIKKHQKYKRTGVYKYFKIKKKS